MDGENTASGPMDEEEILKVELDVLRREHRELDTQVRQIEEGPAPDAIAVRRLKRRKLALKDEIARLEDRLYPDILA